MYIYSTFRGFYECTLVKCGHDDMKFIEQFGEFLHTMVEIVMNNEVDTSNNYHDHQQSEDTKYYDIYILITAIISNHGIHIRKQYIEGIHKMKIRPLSRYYYNNIGDMTTTFKKYCEELNLNDVSFGI
jgi:hypothetical protein